MENKKHIVTIGGSGMVGSRISELLGDKYRFTDASRETGADITKKETVLPFLQEAKPDVVILLAAKADVEGCEEDKPIDTHFLQNGVSQEELLEKQTAWAINVIGAENVVTACAILGIHVIYISTDFVFGGEGTPSGGFTEEDSPHPINWYGHTKYEAEKRVMEGTMPYSIVRIAYPYRASFEPKKDFVRSFISLLSQGKSLSLITDHINNPTFIDDIVEALDVIVEKQATGIFHVTGSQALTPYEQGLLITKVFGFNSDLIGKTTRSEFFKDRAPRPFDLSMKNDKITTLGVKMKTFEEGLEEVKKQLDR